MNGIKKLISSKTTTELGGNNLNRVMCKNEKHEELLIDDKSVSSGD